MKSHAQTRMSLSVIAIGLFAISAPINAQTSDGFSPAEETVCDPLMADGITKGLYGLCVAFCEAQDHASILQAISEEDYDALAAAAPSGEILANYNKKKTESDPAMPCVRTEDPCPCWSPSDLAQFDGYFSNGAPATLKECDEAGNFASVYQTDGEFQGAEAGALYATPSGSLCYFVSTDDPDRGFVFLAGLPDEQGLACLASLQDFQATSGFCPPVEP